MQKFYSHGKLLITGEYVVLDGATALALPTRFGQSIEVKKAENGFIQWTSYDHEENIWFEAEIALDEITRHTVEQKEEDKFRKRLVFILREAHQANPKLLQKDKGFQVTTFTEFPLDWGLGTSSTLIANIANWFSIDPFELQEKTFGGSGYDIAVAIEDSAVTYELTKSGRSILTTSFHPDFSDSIFFVHLNRKQNSRESIQHYKKQEKEALATACEKISRLTHQVITCSSLSEFNLLLEIHEQIISQLINLPKVKTSFFPDYSGGIKSLGGWGGDFILATGGEAEQDYFRKKGYETIIPYSEMIL
ncbi:Mevalonate kinase [Salinimicrobium catena]|uniref:Mevalonate kinase n=1 Tax=Salinimicrobium catena TaxID=390640 RepID=A0A1H5JXT5_9FLAO|nr:GYDIA family GHMP kinase [Salinimicrobium catena]SDK91616.1 Mevalonate kinase [Salinimicrobium catena]SEE57322.1 Mevalonate kinase [Salinimicrobium catena]